MKYEGPIDQGDIFSYWCHKPLCQHDTFEYWLCAEITKMTFVDQPTQDEDFFVQAKIEVHLRLKSIFSDEIFEKCFNAQIGYSKEKKTYFFIYWPPHKRKMQVMLMNSIFSNESFGQTISMANHRLKHEAELIVRHMIKSLSLTKQPV
ncbi:MAG: hypothetical protein US94_C0016G0002 [Berkelbacteria bacterium GW2011_GWB1_38_5]|uniref:Uncharacterized protein n=1 Tax=Berkelbacteria bacterium GW2011_GWB1_38_5 TaxID=1618336 RepID=A0A0G0KET0_9BACT|nr:MAG: hypothetical protein US94_C0016G0002 [Berkelbacteria bacterium GW2011_GWB1_38_5]